MNADEVDHDAYRRWWETVGRGDLAVCTCGNPAEDLVMGPVRIPAGHGLCPRHRFDLSGADRETFAQWIIAGTFAEQDLDEWQRRKAERVAEGKPPFDA